MNDIIFAKYMTVALRNQSKLPTTIKMRVTKKKKKREKKKKKKKKEKKKAF